jgi:hypothetical protein
MLQFARNVLGLIGAVLLMGVIVFAAFVLWRSNPGVNIGLFMAAGGIVYTMIILFFLHR